MGERKETTTLSRTFVRERSLRVSHKSFAVVRPPLFATTVVFLGQPACVCVPFALHIASLTARGILPTDLTVMTSAIRGGEAISILNLQYLWNEESRWSMLKETLS